MSSINEFQKLLGGKDLIEEITMFLNKEKQDNKKIDTLMDDLSGIGLTIENMEEDSDKRIEEDLDKMIEEDLSRTEGLPSNNSTESEIYLLKNEGHSSDALFKVLDSNPNNCSPWFSDSDYNSGSEAKSGDMMDLS